MTVQQFTVLLNDSLKRHILGLPSKEKRRLREKFEFLEAGIWDSGLRVKKLKSFSNRVLFEARLSKAHRILFSLGRRDSHTEIYIWGLLGHDDVGRAARKIFPDNAPFLEFEPETIEEFPELALERVEDVYCSQERIEARVPEDYGPQKWLVLDEDEWKRLLLAAGPEDLEIHLYLTPEQKKVLETEPPILISGTAGSGKTTISVYYLLKERFLGKKRLFLTYSPLLKDFSQTIYTGLVARTGLETAGSPPEFFVFQELLRKITGGAAQSFPEGKEVGLREFETMFRNHRLHQKYDAELVWEEIRSIIKGAKPPLRLDRFRRLVDTFRKNSLAQKDLAELKEYLLGLNKLEIFARVEAFLQRKTAYPKLEMFVKGLAPGGESNGETMAILEEIGNILERRPRNFSSPLLTYPEYLSLGKKRAPNFLYERKDIYEIAEYYQLRLEETGRWDEIDLCRHVLEHMTKNAGERFKYDLVVCDEVQDFADIQLSLLFRLAGSAQGLVLSGDPKQIINPSGFRWEEVKNRFYERGLQVPPLHHLSLNFRSVGSIVRLANALLDMKQQLIGLTGAELKEEWKFNGRPPFLLTETDESKILRNLATRGAGRIVLVRDREEQRRLKASLQTELVFTIHEAKGLEFDTALLWKFSSDRKSSSIWRKIRTGGVFDRTQIPHIRHEINLLYVAVTRARNTLFIYDPSAEVWDIPALSDHLFRTGERDALSEIWQRVSTLEEWERQGEYFFAREHFPAAAECFKNAGNPARSEVARAFDLQRKGCYEDAGALFEKHGSLERAAQCYETGGLIEKALLIWESLGDGERVFLCRIGLYERSGEFEKAGDGWLAKGQVDRALENWKKAGANKKLGEWFKGSKQFKEAAEAFESAREHDQAAFCYKKAGQPQKAADLYFRQEKWEEAIPLFKKLRNPTRLLECYLKSNDYGNAAILCEKGGAVQEAIRCFEAFAQQSPENRAALLSEANECHTGKTKPKALKAAIRFSALGMYDRSAPLLQNAGFSKIALSQYTSLGDHGNAAECHIALQDYYAAAAEIEKANVPDKWNRVTELLVQFVSRSREDPKIMQTLLKEADSFFERGADDSALSRYKAVWARDQIRKVYHVLDRDEEAIEWFLRRGLFADILIYLKEKKGIAVSVNFVLRTVNECRDKPYLRYRDKGIREEVATRLITGALRKGREKELLDASDELLSYIAFDKGRAPDHVLDLMKRSRNSNAVFRLAKSVSSMKKSIPRKSKAFFKEVEDLAEKENDRALSACYWFIKDKEKFSEILDGLEVDPFNYELFAESKSHYARAVEYLAGKNLLEEAALICRTHQDCGRAARLFDEAGQHLRAAGEYRDAGLYEDAIRCYSLSGDERGIAVVYERMGDTESALRIWNKLGNKREQGKLLRKSGGVNGTCDRVVTTNFRPDRL